MKLRKIHIAERNWKWWKWYEEHDYVVIISPEEAINKVLCRKITDDSCKLNSSKIKSFIIHHYDDLLINNGLAFHTFPQYNMDACDYFGRPLFALPRKKRI
jgi:hypothetical protein